MRRVTAALVVVGVAFVTHPSVATATTPPTEPAGTVAGEGQAEAKAGLLVLSDFPTGWTEVVEEAPTEQERSYQAQIAACAGGTGDNLLDLGGPKAQTPDFVGPDEQRVEQSVTIVEAEVAEDLMMRLGAPGVDTCFQDAVVEFTTERFGRADDPSTSTPNDVIVGDVTIGEVLLAPAGDELVAYRVTLPLTVSDFDVEAFVDFVVVRSGGSLAGFTFQSVFEPVPADEVDHYIDVAVSRLPG